MTALERAGHDLPVGGRVMKAARGKSVHLKPEDLTPEVLQRARRAAARAAKLIGPEAYWVVEKMEEIWARRGPHRHDGMLARIDAILAEASPVQVDLPKMTQKRKRPE